jgi:hypothetical protein
MRALCGAIITAGALIGLGLATLGYGIRYQPLSNQENPNTHFLWGAPSMGLALVVLLISVGIGLGIAFVGLAFHHERRYRELLREGGQATTRVPV